MGRWLLLLVTLYTWYLWLGSGYWYVPPTPVQTTFADACLKAMQGSLPKDLYVSLDFDLPDDAAYYRTEERAPKYSRCGAGESILFENNEIDPSLLKSSSGCPVEIHAPVEKTFEIAVDTIYYPPGAKRFIGPVAGTSGMLWVLSRVYAPDDPTDVRSNWSGQSRYRGVLSKLRSLQENRKETSVNVSDLLSGVGDAEGKSPPDPYLLLSDRPVVTVPDFTPYFVPLGKPAACMMLKITPAQRQRMQGNTLVGTLGPLYRRDYKAFEEAPGLRFPSSAGMLTYKDEPDFRADASRWAEVWLSVAIFLSGWTIAVFVYRLSRRRAKQ